MPTILNAANEVAVELFLENKIKFMQISEIIEECMNKFTYINNFTVTDILESDIKVREYVYSKYRE